MDEKTAKMLIPKVEALKTFLRNVAIASDFLPDNKTRNNYRKMYEDISKTINDPDLEIYAPPLPHLGTTGDSQTLRPRHQIRILDSGNRLIAYLLPLLNNALPAHTLNARLKSFISFRFSPKGKSYANEVTEFLEAAGIDVVRGDRFEPRRIHEKLNDILGLDLDFGVLIIAEEGESMWTRDEVNKLWNEGKYVIVLVSDAASFSPGLQGDLEWIPFNEDNISMTFTKMLQGIEFIKNKKVQK